MIYPMPRRSMHRTVRLPGGEVRRTPRRITSPLREFTDHIKAAHSIHVKTAVVVRQSPNSPKYVRLDTDGQGVEDGVDYPVYTGLSSTIVGAAGGPSAGSEIALWNIDNAGWHVRETRNY
jgi:hypothetical protein